MNKSFQRSRQTGSLLLEVIVSLLILAIGLLALYRLQLGLVTQSSVSTQKNFAAENAMRMMESIRSNKFQLTSSETALQNTIKGTDSYAGDAAQFTFNLTPSSVSGMTGLTRYVNQVTWTDQYNRNQSLLMVSYANTWMQTTMNSVGGGGNNGGVIGTGITAPEFQKDKTYKNKSVVSKDGKQYILALPSGTDNIVGSDSNAPGVNNLWKEVQYYADGTLTWYNVQADYGICSVSALGSDGNPTQCAPQQTSGILQRTLCEKQDGTGTNCYRDNKDKNYYKYNGTTTLNGNKTGYYAYSMSMSYSCLSSSPSMQITLTCQESQGSQLTNVATPVTVNTSKPAGPPYASGTQFKHFDTSTGSKVAYDVPIVPVSDPLFKTSLQPTLPTECTPDFVFWETVTTLTFGNVLYRQGDAVCFMNGTTPTIYIAQAEISYQYNNQWGTTATFTPPTQTAIWSPNTATCDPSTIASNKLITPANVSSFTNGTVGCFSDTYGNNTVTTGIWAVVTNQTTSNTSSMPSAVGSKWTFVWTNGKSGGQRQCYKANTSNPSAAAFATQITCPS